MIEEFAAAKVNLALHVLGRRADGYHELDSLVAFADVGDRLTFEACDRLEFTASGPFSGEIPAAGDSQIVLRAAAALQAVAGVTRGARIHLQKNLPAASGIGGGSADAAAALRGLSRLWGVTADLHSLGLKLGADVPVCLISRACRMRGIGERIEPWPEFAGGPALLVNPRVPVATADVFHALGLTAGARHRAPIAALDGLQDCRNDLTESAISVRPEIGETLNSLTFAKLARMSGSGASCFALFDAWEAAVEAEARLKASRPDWWIAATRLS